MKTSGGVAGARDGSIGSSVGGKPAFKLISFCLRRGTKIGARA